MSFSGDGRFLITQTNGPDWLLSFWNWDKVKHIGSKASVDASTFAPGITPAIYQISFNRYDAMMAVVVGKNLFRCFRHDDDGMTSVSTMPDLSEEVPMVELFL